MNKKEKEQLLELIERVTRLETTISLEFKNLREDLKSMTKHVGKLNEEYGSLSTQLIDLRHRQEKLEDSYKTEVKRWKFIAGLVSPVVTYLLIELVKLLAKFLV